VAGGGAEQVEERRRRARKVATGSVWRGKGGRGGVHSELGAAALMAAAAAVPGGKERVELALALREEGERGEGVVELAGWF